MKQYLQTHKWQLAMTALLLVAIALGIAPHDSAFGVAPLMMLNTAAFPLNPALTAIAIGYRNPDINLIADRVLPRLPTAKKFAYTIYNAAQGYSVPNTKVGRKSEPTMADFGGTLQNGECVDYGLDDLVPNDEIKAWEDMPKPSSGGPLSPLSISTMMLTGLVELDREVRVANQVFNTSNFAAGNQATLSGTSQWSDYVNSNPLNALLFALDQTLIRPNKLVLGQQAWTGLRQHPKIVNAVFRTPQNSGSVPKEALAELLEIDEVIVGTGFVNTAKKGQAPNYVRVWGKHAALLSVSLAAAQAMQPTFGFTAQWGTRIAGDIPEPKAGLRGGTRVRSGESVQEVITCTDAGYFFQNCIA
jgi:hypothetical protein